MISICKCGTEVSCRKKPSGCCISIHCRQLDHLSLRLARMRPGCPLETSAAMMRFPHHGDPTQNASKKRPKVEGFRGLFDADAKIRKKP